jgi:hypothetical protein
LEKTFETRSRGGTDLPEAKRAIRQLVRLSSHRDEVLHLLPAELGEG